MIKLSLAVKKIELIIAWLFLTAIITLAALSVYAAFLGAEHTRILFSSPALQIFWLALIALLFIRLALFQPLRKEPGMLCMYLGVALILAGGLRGTESSLGRWPKLQSPSSGYLTLFAGNVQTTLTSGDMETVSGELPFGLRLESFRIEYYPDDDNGQTPTRSFASEVTILENGAAVATKTIRVNYPLYYKNYHIYQHSYDTRDHRYTVLYVKSARGLQLVYAGFILLGLGVMWWGWAEPLKTEKVRWN
ncbi:MAG: cytochrome c biogenesis protein ResB [Candidatus Omnitrophica bacterium]|nr:cytochrome c biogenesis protein ResB [Candidatus Omnitrophota bacterium]